MYHDFLHATLIYPGVGFPYYDYPMHIDMCTPTPFHHYIICHLPLKGCTMDIPPVEKSRASLVRRFVFLIIACDILYAS